MTHQSIEFLLTLNGVTMLTLTLTLAIHLFFHK
jgi:hypothetical protein